MKPVNSFNPFSIVMCNLWYNLQLVECGHCLIEVEVERIHNILLGDV